MRTIFSVAAKLLGVYLAFVGSIYFVGAAALAAGGGERAPVLIQALSAALAWAFAFVLTFRTDGLARRVGVSPEASASLGAFEPRAALRTGVVLVGLYVFLTRLGLALSTVSSYLSGTHFGGLGGAPVRIAIECLPLALAAVFVFRAERVVYLVSRDTAAVA